MIFLRKILFPFALVYGWITQFRNFLFDVGILKSYSFHIPVIAVGNLTVGGTGKTPQIEYLVRLLSEQYSVATLSRGYKRKSKGFILADENSNAMILGDEPYQMHLKFPKIQVAVDADRKNGIEQLLLQKNKPEIIVLDDAFQHRKVKAGFYILLTTYDDLFVNDWMLPTGNLRESRNGAKRADLIVVTKCPTTISESDRSRIREKLGIDKPLFFSTISYDDSVYSLNSVKSIAEIKSIPKLLVAGIAKPQPFFEYMQNENDDIMEFTDHHHFTEKDIDKIKNRAGNRFIITTEKDFVRLKDSIQNTQLFYLPIRTKLLVDAIDFDTIVLEYAKSKSTK
jgi:tetraacyldisaccharide 4'-kinase